MPITPDPSRIRVATVAPGIEPWRSEMVRLFRSFEALDGPLAQAQRVAYVDRVIDVDSLHLLRRLGVRVFLASPIDPRCAMGNNMLMLDLDGSYDWLIMLDSDVVAARDFSHVFTDSAIRVAPADHCGISEEEWGRIFGHFNLPIPSERYLTRASAQPVIPYFNTGIQVVPAPLVLPLRAAWHHYLVKLADAFDGKEFGPNIERHEAFADQIAYSLAIASAQLPYRPLEHAMHVLTHGLISPAHHPEELQPYLLHYHHRVDERGEILLTGYRGIDNAISTVNRSLAAVSTSPEG